MQNEKHLIGETKYSEMQEYIKKSGRLVEIKETPIDMPEFKTKTVNLIQGEADFPTKEILKRQTR